MSAHADDVRGDASAPARARPQRATLSESSRLLRAMPAAPLPKPQITAAVAAPSAHHHGVGNYNAKAAAMQVLVLGTSMQAANRSCFSVESAGCRCPCASWAGPKISSLNDSDVKSMARSGLISHPSNTYGRLSILSSSMLHLTAWQLVADAQEHGPTLVVHDDESVRVEAAGRVIGLLTNASAFKPSFDLFFLNPTHFYGIRSSDVVAPEHALLVPTSEPRVGALASSLRGSAYALTAAGAVRLLMLLRGDRPDISQVSLQAWMTTKLLERGNASAGGGMPSSGLHAFAWDRNGELIQRHAPTRAPAASNSGLLSRLWHAFTSHGASEKHLHLHRRQ